MVYFYSISFCFGLLFSSAGLANPVVVLSSYMKAPPAEFQAFDITTAEPDQEHDPVRIHLSESLGITELPLSIEDLF